MKDTLKTFIGFLLAIITIFLMLWAFWTTFLKSDVKQIIDEYWEHKDFKTDTIHFSLEYGDIILPPYPEYVPPKVVIEYLPSQIKGIKLEVYDSLILVIDSLKQITTKIDPSFLKLYPNSSKLIYSNFTEDSLRLDLLTIDGQIRTENYLVNYDRFNYQYRDNQFKALERNFSKDRGDRRENYYNLYFTGGYGFLLQKPILGVQFDNSLFHDKFSLSTEAYFTIQEIPRLSLQTKLRYQLK